MKTIAIIIALTIVGIVAFSLAGSFITNTTTTTTSSASNASTITVTISGAVTRAGTFVLNTGSVLQDLIAAADGATSNADTLAYNVDYALKNKGSYYIAPLYDNSNTCATTPITKVNINSGAEQDLIDIGGFGKVAAGNIVSYRTSHTFQAIEEIKDVSGIGDATFRSVRDRIKLRDAS